jgi:hypothetical protein
VEPFALRGAVEGELMAQGEVLQHETAARAEERENRREHGLEDRGHADQPGLEGPEGKARRTDEFVEGTTGYFDDIYVK